MTLSPSLLDYRGLLELTKGEAASRTELRVTVSNVAAIGDAGEGSVVFAQDEASFAAALASRADVLLVARALRRDTEGDARQADARVVWVKDARLAFARVAGALRAPPHVEEIHPSAVVAATAMLGQRAQIGPGVVICDGVVVGDDVVLAARVVVHAGVRLGDRVEVQAGAVLGGTGFGWVRDRETGEYVRFPQQGRLVIEDDVAIGANCTIDRGALGETRIGAGTKLDNLVHIGHSCSIGRRVVIAAQTGIAGSSVIGDDAVIAGQVGIADHVEIGAGVVLGAKCGVPSNKILRGAGQVFWGIPARPIQQYLRELAGLRRGLKRAER